MEKDSIKMIKKIQKLKKKTRDRNVRIKLELFILAHKLGNVSEACYQRGFGRNFYYKWWNRLLKSKFKISSLNEKSRRPKKSPRKTKKSLEVRVKELNSKGYGARMIEAVLSRENKKLSRSVIGHILNGRKRPCKNTKRQLKSHQKRYELPIPGQRVQIDVKYVPKLIRGKRAYCFNAIDECTRFKFAKCFMELSEHSTYKFLKELKENFPFPIFCIQTDNGFEFTNRFNRFKDSWDHSVSIWCKENGVQHRLIPPGAKELNGKVERSHRIDEQYFYWKAPEQSVEGLNLALKDWIRTYNEYRPHGGINYQTPHEKLRERLSTLLNLRLDEKLRFLQKRFLKEGQVLYLKKYNPKRYKRLKMAA